MFDNHYQVAKFYTLTEHLIVPEILVFSRKTLGHAVGGRSGAACASSAREAQAEERVLWKAYEKQAMDKARAAGIEIVETIDKKPFQDAVKPVWDKYGPRFAEHDQAHPSGRLQERNRDDGAARSRARGRACSMARTIRSSDGRALSALRRALAGTALVLISAVIPWAVYTRYVLNSAASWPEPTAVLLMIVLTFFGAAACYRVGMHMRMSFFVSLLPPHLAASAARSSSSC